VAQFQSRGLAQSRCSAASESEPSCRGPPLGNCGATPTGYDVLDPGVAVLQASADEAIQRAEADAAVSAAETRIADTERQAQEAAGRTAGVAAVTRGG